MALSKGAKKGIIIAGAVLLLGGLGVGAYFMFRKPKKRTIESNGNGGNGEAGKESIDPEATQAIQAVTDPSITTAPKDATIEEVIKVVDANSIDATDEEINHVALGLTSQAKPDNRKPMTVFEAKLFGLVLQSRHKKPTTPAEIKKAKEEAIKAKGGRG